MASSSNNLERSLSSSLTSLTPLTSSSFHYRSLNSISQLESTKMDASWNELSDTSDITNRLEQIKVNSDIQSASSYSTTLPADEALAGEKLIERFRELINVFMTRPGRQYSYDTTIRWTLDHGNIIDYNVVILINRASGSM